MCGIFLSISRGQPLSVTPHIKELLRRRGPDSCSSRTFNCSAEVSGHGANDAVTHTNDWHISTCSTVLGLRGDAVTTQPVVLRDDQAQHAQDGSFLCWNGEAWTFAGAEVTENDSQHVFALLSAVLEAAEKTSTTSFETLVAKALAMYAGPYAFAFYHRSSQRIYFGRDFLGRRSLLYRRTEDGGILVCSVPDSPASDWHEVEADGIYWIDLQKSKTTTLDVLKVPYWCSNEQAQHGLPFLDLSRSALPDATSKSSDPSQFVDTLHHLLRRALHLRLTNIRQDSDQETAAHVAFLFSGGLDCTILAQIAHTLTPEDQPIDLLNVAFENPRVHGKLATENASPYDLCPDRKTALASVNELRTICSNRVWRLVCINVPYTEYLEHRQGIIDLIHPHNTEMDLSIACALYFAARGAGLLEDGTPYTTSARVLLSGLGADELFAGYTRHATAFGRGGLKELEDELALDISRLGRRNLGRDDRVISHWSKEARYPFLDEELVRWALKVPTTDKCGFGQPPSLDAHGKAIDPAKLILRRLAIKLGMEGVAHEKKRAIQFGARTAKMTEGRSKGTQLLAA